MIKFFKEQVCQFYGNPIRILSDGDPKFDSAAVRDYTSSASIDWKIISAYNPRGNAKVERIFETLKRAVMKVLVCSKDRYWDECIALITEDTEDYPELTENLLSKYSLESGSGLLLNHHNFS